MSANFVQISSQSGRTQTFAASTAQQTFQFLPTALKGQLPGGDYIYASRIRVRVQGSLQASTGTPLPPNWEQFAQVFGQVRVYSQFLGDVVNRTHNSVPIVANHDAMFYSNFSPPTRKRFLTALSTGSPSTVEYEFEIPFGRDDLYRPTDSCPWLPLFEGGMIEFDFQPSNSLSFLGINVVGNWTAEVVIDWFPDKQALVHVPVANRLYRPVTVGPEYILKGVGAPQGLDGVVSGARLAKLSWLFQGRNTGTAYNNVGTGTFRDNGFYAAFGGGGIQPFSNGLTRMDVPFRDQVSINAVSAWISSFLRDTGAVRHVYQNVPGTAAASEQQNDLAGWPYNMRADYSDHADFVNSIAQIGSLIVDSLNFWPIVWNGAGAKISDMQKVDGDLTFTADLTTPPGGSVLHLFRTEEICSFSRDKVLDVMDRMGLRHKDRGGNYLYVPKYADNKRADLTTQWGMPLKIVQAA